MGEKGRTRKKFHMLEAETVKIVILMNEEPAYPSVPRALAGPYAKE